MTDRSAAVLPALFRIAKFPISLWVSVTAALGSAMASPIMDVTFFTTSGAVFLLASGSGTLNNIQDRSVDRELKRTRNRPLAAGTLNVGLAAAQAMFLLASGFLGLSLVQNGPYAVCLGFIAVILYNGIYTPLKQRTLLAIFPGAACGAIPVVIGWVAAGGRDGISGMLAVTAVMAVWQLPHFWLVVLTHSNDYAGSFLPSMLRMFSGKRLERILLVWVALYSAMTVMIPLFMRVSGPAAVLLGINALGLTCFFVVIQAIPQTRRYQGRETMAMNLGMMVFVSVLLVDRLMSA